MISDDHNWQRTTQMWLYGVFLFGMLQAGLCNSSHASNRIVEIIVLGEAQDLTSQTQRIANSLVRRELADESPQNLAAALDSAVKDAGYLFSNVSLESYDKSTGVLTVAVSSINVGQIKVTGNQAYSVENVIRSLPSLEIGAPVHMGSLERNLSVANQIFSKAATVSFSIDQSTQDLIAQVNLNDASPKHTYAWLDSTGTKNTGRMRAGLGFQHSNLFDRDHTGSATVSTSVTQPEDVQTLGLSYRVPVYRTHGHLNWSYSNSRVDSGTIDEVFEVKGQGKTTSFGYTQSLTTVGDYTQNLGISLRDSTSDNDIDHQGQPLGSVVRSRPIEIRYEGKWESGALSYTGYASYLKNVESGSNNNFAAYNRVRAGATPDWSANRVGGSIQYRKENWAVNAQANLFFSNDLLVPNEQYYAGGMNTLLGFEENELYGDKGIDFKIAVTTPAFKNNLRFHGELGYAKSERQDSRENSLINEDIASAGVGASWNWKQKLYTTLKVGYVLDGIESGNDSATAKGDIKGHISVYYRLGGN